MLTFPQASLRSRAAGFPRLGSDLGIALQAFPTTAKLKCWHTYTPRQVVCFACWSLWWLIPFTGRAIDGEGLTPLRTDRLVGYSVCLRSSLSLLHDAVKAAP